MVRERKIQRQAVALHYDQPTDSTPKVLASGQGDVAEQIIAAAKSAGIDIVEDSDLLEVLGRVPLGTEIPEELFEAVAEILAFIYRINGRYASLNDD
jgi:flagellar biosynthesis protein